LDGPANQVRLAQARIGPNNVTSFGCDSIWGRVFELPRRSQRTLRKKFRISVYSAISAVNLCPAEKIRPHSESHPATFAFYGVDAYTGIYSVHENCLCIGKQPHKYPSNSIQIYAGGVQ
jgi:hypothetical protein